MAKSLLFSFDDLTDKNRVVRSVKKQFEALGAVVVAVDVPARVKRTAGITYRELSLSFADSQIVTFRVKQTGDIFEVRLNGKTLPIKEQDDQRKALKEIADAMDKGRTAFQRKLQRVRVDGSGSYDKVYENVKLWLSQYPEGITKVTFSSSSFTCSLILENSRLKEQSPGVFFH